MTTEMVVNWAVKVAWRRGISDRGHAASFSGRGDTGINWLFADGPVPPCAWPVPLGCMVRRSDEHVCFPD